MKTCSLCSTPIDDAARACPRCGIATAVRVPARGRVARALRTFAVAATGLAVLGVLALPLVRSAPRGTSLCEPHSWTDWHVAIEQACLTPTYVCENMTSAKLLQDPALAGELQESTGAGRPGARAHLDALVGHLREVYGCEGAQGAGDPHGLRRAGPEPRLPPGHPPIPSAPGSPMFDGPPTVTI